MPGEERRFVIERRGGGGGPYMGPKQFSAAPEAGTGIQRSLEAAVKHGDKLTDFANRSYLLARAVAPAIRLVPGLGPVMAGATIAAGRGIAATVAELKAGNAAGFGDIKTIGTGVMSLMKDLGVLFTLIWTKGSWREQAGKMGGNLNVLGKGMGGLAGGVLRVLPIVGLISASVMSILAFSKLFRSILGHMFGLMSAALDIMLLPFLPFLTGMIDQMTGILGVSQRVSNLLSTPGVITGGTIGGLIGSIIGFFKGGFIGAIVGGFLGSALGGFVGWLVATLGAWKTGSLLGAATVGGIAGFIVGGPLGALVGAIVGSAVGAIIGWIKEIFDWMKGIPRWIYQSILLPIGRFFSIVGMGLGIIGRVIESAMKAVESAIWNALQWFWGALRGQFLKDVGAIGSFLGGMKFWQQGTPYVPETGPAIVHRGEMIVPSHLRQFVGMTQVNYFLLGTAQTGGGVGPQISRELEHTLRRIFPS